MTDNKLKAKKETLKVANSKQETTIKKTVQAAKVERIKATAAGKSMNISNKLKADVYDLSGKVVESINLPAEIFGVKVNKKLIAQAVRVYLANQRTGSATTKTRGEVRGSTRKIYRQKGTGRARHGAVRAPIFVHGGIAHGPKSRDFSLKMPQKMKRAALNSLLSLKMNSGEIKILSDAENADGKTKNIIKFLRTVKLEGKKILFVFGKKQEKFMLAARNVKGVSFELAKQLHIYELMHSQEILFIKDSIIELENLTKNNRSNKQV